MSAAVRRMRLKASATVIVRFRSRNSVVISEPAESSGYLRISLTLLRVSGSAWRKMRLTTFAGISSTRSAASSTYSSSRTSFSSVLEKPRISSSCASGSSSTNTSAAGSFGSSRNSSGSCRASRSSSSAAMSAGSSCASWSRRAAYCLRASRSRMHSSSSSRCSSKSTIPAPPFRVLEVIVYAFLRAVSIKFSG